MNFYQNRYQYYRTKIYTEHGIINADNDEDAEIRIKKNKGKIIEKKEEEKVEIVEDYD